MLFRTMSLPKKLLAGALLVAATWLVAEVAAWAGLLALDGRAFRPGRLAAERERVVASEGRALAEGPVPSRRPLPDPGVSEEVLHPFLGYVVDPEINERPERVAGGALRVGQLGFWQVPAPGGARRGGEVRVGVFGGSVAMLFAFEGREALVRALAEVPAFRGRRIVVRCFALGGYKQPQQHMALAWLLLLGERLDVVVNLDGFNEVALPWADNVPRHVFPLYPRNWDLLTRTLDDREEQRRAGLVAYLEGERADLARAFSRPPLAASPLANLVWRWRDRRLERAIGAAQRHLAAGGPRGRRFGVRGPRRAYASDEALFADLARSWRDASLQMHLLATANGVPYFHFLQPNQYLPGAKPMGRGERERAIDPGHVYREAVERGYPLLRREGEELVRRGVAFADLTQVFAGVEEPLYIDRCCHVDRRGSEILGERIGRVIAGALTPGG